MTNTPKRTRPIKEVSLSVLEARLNRAVRPKVRLWAMIHLAEELIGKDATQAERSLTLFAEAEQLAKSIGDRRGIATAIRGTGSCQLYLSNLDAALELLERALPIAEQTGDAECEILILRDMGKVYRRQGNQDHALVALQKCSELAELIGNHRVLGSALGQMEAAFMNLGRYHEALECHTRSLASIERTSDKLRSIRLFMV